MDNIEGCKRKHTTQYLGWLLCGLVTCLCLAMSWETHAATPKKQKTKKQKTKKQQKTKQKNISRRRGAVLPALDSSGVPLWPGKRMTQSKAAAIMRIFRARRRMLRYCLTVQLQKHPHTTPRPLSLRWTIGKKGKVISAKLKMKHTKKTTRKQAKALEACFLGALKTMTFPKPVGGNITIEQPFSHDASH